MTMIERAGGKETPPTRALCSGHHLGFLHGCVADHTLSRDSETAVGTNEGLGGLQRTLQATTSRQLPPVPQPGGHPPPGEGADTGQK